MVSAAPEQVKRDAEQMFRASATPKTFEFAERLSPLNKRLFVRDLWTALSKVSISGTVEDLEELVAMIESWEATADLESVPEILELVRRKKHYTAIAV